MKYFKLVIITLVLFIVSSSAYCTEKKEENTTQIPVSKWLQLGPIPTPFPAFHQRKNIEGEKFTLKHILKYEQIRVKDWWPKEGVLFNGKTLKWSVVLADSNSLSLQTFSTNGTPDVVYLATYIEVKQWLKAKLEVFSFHLLQVYLDGTLLTSKTTSDKPKDDTSKVESGKTTQEIKLVTGKHLLLVKALRDPDNNQNWNVRATLEISEKYKDKALHLTVSPKHNMNIKHLLDGPKVQNVSISADGELAALSIKQSFPADGTTESWLEIRRTKDGSLQQTFRGGMKIPGITWAPKGQRFSYQSDNKGQSTLWIVDLVQGTTRPILENVKNVSSHTWSPDETFIIYSVTENHEANKTGIKKVQGMPDLQPGWRDRDFLHLVNIPDGTRRRLTAGKLTTDFAGISPDGKKLLFSRSVVDFSERPYSKDEFLILDLVTMKLDSLWTDNWAEAALWSPDGQKLLVTGGPSSFGGTGVNLPQGAIPNEYDRQAYIYDLATKKVEPITMNFAPAINKAFWSRTSKYIFLNTTDRSTRHLYRYDVKKKKFEMIKTGVEFVKRINISLNSAMAVYTGSSAASPQKAYVINLENNKYRILSDPGKDDYQNVELHPVERWTFINNRGIEIEGRIYYPPNFDPKNKYPCIVYYYGGTVPTTRDFGGRYPKNLFAAQGYVVYVLQPSGAIGYGQEFSALHVNDWGIIVADEIIDGTKKFVAAHPFVDEKRVGCIGASFGGFLTMLLQTRTDMFAAAIAHAGISSIASYWGEGYWGYLYSALATANSFPWNRKDIYINQSPLFHADKINTPLLLLHGLADTNVPPGESIQFYTALKLLGKEVEFIQIEGQNHHIVNYKKRILWMKSILAWFDKWLKEQPQWWDDLYPQQVLN